MFITKKKKCKIMTQGRKVDLITESEDLAKRILNDHKDILDFDRQCFFGPNEKPIIFWGMNEDDFIRYLDYIEPELSESDKEATYIRMRRDGRVITDEAEIERRIDERLLARKY